MINKVAHRGNTKGRNLALENKPSVIERVSKDFYVEVDVWYRDNSYWLGHDTPDYQVSLSFLKNAKLFCHAKNIEALHQMLKDEVHCFWHEGDEVTLTSKGYVWKYPEVYYNGSLWGVCSDWL